MDAGWLLPIRQKLFFTPRDKVAEALGTVQSNGGDGDGGCRLMLGEAILGAILLSAAWVGLDASERDFSECDNWYWRSTAGWVIACLILWIAYFPLYLSARRKVPLKSETRASRPCNRCGERVSNGVLDCPHCGFDFRTIGTG